MKRYKYIFLAFLCFPCVLQAEVQMRYRGAVTAGSYMKGSIADGWIGQRPILGGEVAVEFLPTGRWESLQWYNNASLGIAFDYLNLTNDKYLGQAFAPYIYMNVPLVNLPHFVLGIRPGIGVGFVDKTYYNTVPTEEKGVPGSIRYPTSNGAIGSHTNAYFAEALYMEFPIKRGFAITASYGWYHISNGSIRQPNSGYNMFNGMIGLAYTPHEERYTAPETRVPKHLYEGKRWDVEISASGGVRQAYFADNRYFGVGALSVAAHWRPWSIFKIGGGVDVFYDGYYRSVCDEFSTDNQLVTSFGKTYLRESRIENCFRVGLSLQPEFIVGNFTAGIHFGVYLYDNIKNLEPYTDVEENGGKELHRGVFYAYDILNAGVRQDGWLYTRILLKYRCTRHLFVQLGMKAHLTKVEFIDAGLGICF